VLHAAQAMRAAGVTGSIVTILCDGGERYAHSYYNPDWYAAQGFDMDAADIAMRACAEQAAALPAMPVAGDVTA